MKKYLVGNCIGCGNRTAGAVMTGDDNKDSRHIMEMIKSGHSVKMIETGKPVVVEDCFCKRQAP